MRNLLSFALLLALQSPPFTAPPIKDPALAARIKKLLDVVFTTQDDQQEVAAKAEARAIFSRRGLPAISEVGDEAAYDFVFLLVGTAEDNPELLVRILQQARELSARNELPADAAVFCGARIRLDKAKKAVAARPPSNPQLRDEIENLFTADQAVRQQKGFDLKKMEQVDLQDAPRVTAIFQQFGVPTYEMVGPRAAADFVDLVQHHSAELRRAVLPGLKANVDAGQADPESYALVYDRFHRNVGDKQLYGTQLECGPDRALHEAPLEDPARVNLRRAELGMMRLELYVRFVLQTSPPLCSPSAAQH